MEHEKFSQRDAGGWDSLLRRVHLPQADVDQVFGSDARFDPGEARQDGNLQEGKRRTFWDVWASVFSAQRRFPPTCCRNLGVQLVEKVGHGLSVDVPGGRAERRVDVGVGVHPHHAHAPPHRRRVAVDGADGQAEGHVTRW